MGGLTYDLASWALLVLAPLVYSIGWDSTGFGSLNGMQIFRTVMMKGLSLFLGAGSYYHGGVYAYVS